MTSQLEMQLGKNGLTQSFLEEIKKRFEKPELKNIKISVLKSARESRDDVKKYADELKSCQGYVLHYKMLILHQELCQLLPHNPDKLYA